MGSIKEIINNYSPSDYLEYLKNNQSLDQNIGDLPLAVYDKIVSTINTPVDNTSTLAEYSYISLVDTSVADVIFNLDPAVNYTVGRPYTIIKETAANQLIVTPNGSETINGQATITLVDEGETLNIFTDGNNWFKYVYNVGSGDKTYTHTQASPSTTWNINHGLDKRSSVTIVDSANTVVYGDVSYVDNNNITITFNKAFSGKAYIN